MKFAAAVSWSAYKHPISKATQPALMLMSVYKLSSSICYGSSANIAVRWKFDDIFGYCAVETAFTVTFGRSGEDNKKFKLGNVESTLQGFAGADYQLQVNMMQHTVV